MGSLYVDWSGGGGIYELLYKDIKSDVTRRGLQVFTGRAGPGGDLELGYNPVKIGQTRLGYRVVI